MRCVGWSSLLVFAGLVAACQGSPLTSSPEEKESPSSSQPSGGEALEKGSPSNATARSGRWTSSDFEDPFEAELHFSDGAITGKVCGPDISIEGRSMLEGANCGTVEAGWTRDDGFVHFDFSLPWSDLGVPHAYQLVGAFEREGEVFSAVLQARPAGGGTIVFTRCPPERGWCKAHD